MGKEGKPMIPAIIQNWSLGSHLGSGYSGSIFVSENIHTNKKVALKVQDVDHECPTNRYERYIYPFLQGGKGMPTLWDSGIYGQWDYLAIDLLGSSLDSLHRNAGGPDKPMDLGGVCNIAMQLIARLETMHHRGVLHRDIQLGNAVIGKGSKEQLLYMIDFGFSKVYIDPKTHRHIPNSNAKRDFIGNYWFSSVGVHCRGKVPSRRDDMEALALMLIHLLIPRGLPWTRNGVPKTDEAHEALKKLKRQMPIDELCRGLPSEFEEFLRYCRRLQFAEQPDYGRWIEEFKDLKVERGYDESDAFVWPPPKPKVAPKKTTSPLRLRTPLGANSMENVLNGIANMKLDHAPRAALVDRTNAVGTPRVIVANQKAEHLKKETPVKRMEVIEISSESETSENAGGTVRRVPKARWLARLAKDASTASDKEALGKLLREFMEALQSNSNRSLTKEALVFLDTICLQLENPSADGVLFRPSKARSEVMEPRTDSRTKTQTVVRLRREVREASDVTAVTKMVREFSMVTGQTTGKTITKDGFSFLEGVAQKLTVLKS